MGVPMLWRDDVDWSYRIPTSGIVTPSTEKPIMTHSTDAPLLYVASALRRNFIPWFIAGVCLAFAHLALWPLIHAKTFAIELWLDEAPMATLFLLSITLTSLGAVLYRLRHRPFHQKIAAQVEPAIQTLIHLASITAQVTLGMGTVAVFTGAAPHVLLIAFFILYVIAMMEISTGLWRPAGLSKASPHLLAVLMTLPFIARLL